MKKFYSFALILLTLLSCVVFSACGNAYKNFKMKVFSESGELLEVAEFVIDSQKDCSQTLTVEFSGVDKSEIGKIEVYSLPQELITVTNYSYKGKHCYVEISPNMPSVDNSKLVISHINSSKKKTIDLKIDKKSESINISSDVYAVALPVEGNVEHLINVADVVSLWPSGSTDKVYFKIADGSNVATNINPIKVDVEGYEDVITGFNVSPGSNSSVEIYPVTYMKGYERGENDPYKDFKITIHFRNVLFEENIKIENDIETLNLIANTNDLNLYKLRLIDQDNVSLAESDFYDFYDLTIDSTNKTRISTYTDSNYDIFVKAITHTDKYEKVSINLTPKMPGNLQKFVKNVYVKGDSKADKIYVEKFQEPVEDFTQVNIFDYYDNGGNSLGAMFTFKPVTNSGADVHEDLDRMKIIINPEILSEENCVEVEDGVDVDCTLYSLMIHHISLTPTEPFKEAALLKFYYENGKMVSEPISVDSKVYIKYIKHPSGLGRYTPTDFGMEVQTINESTNEFWKDMEQPSIQLLFNRVEGVAKMDLNAGHYVSNGYYYDFINGAVLNPEYVYLDRSKGVDKDIVGGEEARRTFISIANNSVEGIDGGKLSQADFSVKIEPLQPVENPLRIKFGIIQKDTADSKETGSDVAIYRYDSSDNSDIISLIFRSDTSIGNYKLTIYQENIEKASLICRVYESLPYSLIRYSEVETNDKSFKNEQYKELYPDADYIVAKGQKITISWNLPETILQSDVIADGKYEFQVSLRYLKEDYYNEETGEIHPAFVPDPDYPVDDFVRLKHDVETSPTATVEFLDGTYLKDKPYYVWVSGWLNEKKYDDITKPNDLTDLRIGPNFMFFVYEEINQEEITINHTNMTRYMSDYLGVYYENLSKAELSINMPEDMWNYVTTDTKVEWVIDNESGVEMTQSGYSCKLNFNSVGENSYYERSVSGYIRQFDNLFEFKCVFFVEKPILTEKLVINSNVYDHAGQLYINLKKGETYEVQATNYSKSGDVTNDDIIIQVADEYGNSINVADYFDLTETTLKVKEVNDAYNFSLIVFAKDVLAYILSEQDMGYNSPSSFIKNDFRNLEDKDKYLNAFVKIDIHLSNGTLENPFEIHTYEDFWGIDDSDELSKAHYKLMNSINLSNSRNNGSRVIEGFTGSIFTPEIKDKHGNVLGYEVYTIDGITLTKDNPNLFVDFGIDDEDNVGVTGRISNVRFVVNYNYDIELKPNTSTTVYLGLFKTNKGTLKNVKVQVSGYANLTGNSNVEYYFGGLAGENVQKENAKGKISQGIVYNTGYGVVGEIELKSSNQVNVYFGGLVGKNDYKITGQETVNQAGGNNEIVLSSSSVNSTAISAISITASDFYNNSAIGGVVGYNTGTIKNAYVQTYIIAKNLSNVGGVIGTNRQQVTNIKIFKDSTYLDVDFEPYDRDYLGNETLKEEYNYAIYNVKSASTIVAKKNVGGIVGNDSNGLYIDCDYQILNKTTKYVGIQAETNAGGIAGYSEYGRFVYCSVMSYNWNYSELAKGDKKLVITDVADIVAEDYVGGIVGRAVSSSQPLPQNSIYYEISEGENNRTFIINSSVNAYLETTKTNNPGEKVGNIGGILTSTDGETNISVAFNVYFIGKLDGFINYEEVNTVSGGTTTHHYIVLDNVKQTLYNNVFTINLEENAGNVVAKKGAITIDSENNTNEFNNWYETMPNYSALQQHWSWSDNVNGGYIFVTNDQYGTSTSIPIFDLAPEKIEAEVKNKKAVGLERVLMLDYYDFLLNENMTEEELAELNEKYNRNQKIVDLINIKAEPNGLGKVVVNVKSTNSNVVDISFDGTILINGIGECDLIFSSVLNSNAGVEDKRTIRVVVDHPIGDEFGITMYPNDRGKIISSEIKIAQNTTKQLYVYTSGSKTEHEGTMQERTYFYLTKTNLHLNVKISFGEEILIENYVRISGNGPDSTYNGTNSTMVVDLDDKTPFTISVLKMLEGNNKKFNVEVKPYVKVDNIIVDLLQNGNLIKTNFDLSTVKGVTNASFSYDEAIVYPNDTIYLTLQLETDDPIEYDWSSKIVDTTSLLEKLKLLIENDIATEQEYSMLFNIINNSNVLYEMFVDRSYYVENTKIQTIVFRFEFGDMNLMNPENMEIKLVTDNVRINVMFRIIPQRINKIEINNYYYRQVDEDTATREQADILKPNYPGLIVLNMVPSNAYYDYLEISDVTGDEEIVFIQIEDENGHAYNIQDKSRDGKGIKLYYYETKPSTTLYIRTQISNKYSSKMHKVEVRAYDNLGNLLGEPFVKKIDVKMLPEIHIDHILPDGSVGTYVDTTEQATKSEYIANGVDAIFNITSRNSNRDIVVELDGTAKDSYEIENISGSNYRLKSKENLASNIGGTIKLNVTAYAYMDNGDFDMTTCSLEFTIVSFVIHSVSVEGSIDTLTNKEIYGYFNKSTKLNFYFDKDDISFYDENAVGEKFWDTVYEYNEDYADNYSSDTALYQIYNVLAKLNEFDSRVKVPNGATPSVDIDNIHYGMNDYLILNKNVINKNDNKYSPTYPQGKVFEIEGNTQKVQLFENKLTVQDGYDKENIDGKDVEALKYLAVAFRMYVDGYGNWQVEEYDATTSSENAYIINKNYNLNFMEVTKWDNPDVVNSTEDFLKMESGKQYILNADLRFENYVPIDADLVYFDGNGHTITIHSFAPFVGTTMNAGLFAKVYENMIVKNVRVEYVSLETSGNYSLGHVTASNGVYNVIYSDLGAGAPMLTSAQFGGIAAVNNGVITNCVVSGLMAVDVSSLSGGGNYQSAFNIGGVVAENSETGYITNSHSELSIFALANIGGFVHNNNGKISSCSVGTKSIIYGYNTNLSNTIVSEVAGFVVRNTKQISMSCVNLRYGEYTYTYVIKDPILNTYSDPKTINLFGGQMSAKDISAGFAYSNSGELVDAYVQMTKTGVNNNSFNGFVYENIGTIHRTYTMINGGSIVDNNDSLFAPKNTTGISNSVEFVLQTSGYTSSVSGLTTRSSNEQYTKSSYEKLGFAFGDNKTAVWSISAGQLPVIVSTQEMKFENFEQLDIYDVGDDDLSDGVDNSRFEVDYANYGTKENPFIVHNLETWNLYFDSTKNLYMTSYYRIVKDVDFSSLGKNPLTSDLTFKGNIQGNNMKLLNIMLYSNEGLDALGLFKELKSVDDKSVENSVRNLTLTASSIWASSTESVGLLAGIIDGFNIYNIKIDSERVIMVGQNAVGGLAGVIRGEFDIDQISSNIGANSTRASTLSYHSIYMSKNNQKDASANLNKVYYAGSVAGILDGYSKTVYNINENLTTAKARSFVSDKYYKVNNIIVKGNVTLAGDYVGGAFGFVGERVYLTNVDVNVNGSLFGYQYSAGVVGENRGVVQNATVKMVDSTFNDAKNVMAGAVGMNIGGLVTNVKVESNISKTEYGYLVGGVVGRNVNGVISDVEYTGELFAYVVGGILASDYTSSIFTSITSGSGAISIDCRSNFINIIPQSSVNYNGGEYVHLNNVSLGGDTFVKMIQNSNKFYSYKKVNDSDAGLNAKIVKNKVLGLVVGLSYDDSVVGSIASKKAINIEKTTNVISKVTFNAEMSSTEIKETATYVSGTSNDADFTFTLKLGLTETENITHMFDVTNVIELNPSLGTGISYVMYLLGSQVSSYDAWGNYSTDYVIIK